MKLKALVVMSVFLLAASFTAATAGAARAAEAADPDADYDRMDGTGKSGKKVNVIEWEGNLEIHVYPAGSLKGLALKVDRKNKNKPVMVIGYRFDNDPKTTLIRRAILGIVINDGFKTYRDPSADGYDKIIISNNGLSGQVAEYKLDPEPTQLYPDGHPALAKKDPAEDDAKKKAEAAGKRMPAADEKPGMVDEDGTIKPFRW